MVNGSAIIVNTVAGSIADIDNVYNNNTVTRKDNISWKKKKLPERS